MIHNDSFKQHLEEHRGRKAERDSDVFRSNTLLERAIKYLDHPTDPEQLRSIDVTDIWWQEFAIMVTNKEYLNININGLPASGKSTVGIAIMIEGMRYLKKRYTLWNISRDQTEYGRRIRENSDETNTFMVIDEWNELETTGFNSTKRQAYLEMESDLLGQRFIRKIGCSPKNQVDKNAFIIFEVLQQDKERSITRCLLYYKILIAGNEYQQLLGHVDISVAEAMDDEIYAIYRRRKFERMNLIIKEGVDSPEKLYATRLIADVTKGLVKMARLGFVNKAIVKIDLDTYVTEHKELMSIYGREDVIETIKGTLDAEKEYMNYIRKIQNLKAKMEGKEVIGGKEQLNNLINVSIEIRNKIDTAYKHQEKLLRLLEQYEDMT